MGRLTVADFFCGAGGFSEGFRQAGFKVVFALDHWRPAISTHELNHPDCKHSQQDILELDTPEKIDEVVPDTDVIIGSPPCVSFSGSNKAGKADKTLGIRLIEAYLRIIAHKKSKGKLKYWLLENVPNAGKYIKERYSYKELGLEGEDILEIPNRKIRNAANYGAPQGRKRYVCGDYPEPKQTHNDKNWVTMAHVLDTLGNPCLKNQGKIKDPVYPISLRTKDLTDHFYDTKVAEFEWKSAKRLKEDHGFMGKMSFPEDLDRPSRTVMATRSGSTREAIIFDILDKEGKPTGEYRLPTIREIASFMSFPITYQFQAEGEATKYKLVGNAVCCRLSAALGKAIMDKEKIKAEAAEFKIPIGKLDADLTGTIREPKKVRPRTETAKFAMHIPYQKIRGFRVELNNLESDFKKKRFRWSTVIHQGSGKNALRFSIDAMKLDSVELERFKEFKEDVKEQFKDLNMSHNDLQNAFVANGQCDGLNPEMALDMMKEVVERYYDRDKFFNNGDRVMSIPRDVIPIQTIAGAYACDYFVNLLN